MSDNKSTIKAKPLGHRNYGSIAHLPGSKLGLDDYCVHEGQARILTEKARDRHDNIVVQPKIDGSNVGVANIGGNIIALGRAGYLAETSPYEQHRMFAEWVKSSEESFKRFLQDGWRVAGEWIAQAHSIKYRDPREPFIAFDLMIGHERATYQKLVEVMQFTPFAFVPCLHETNPLPVDQAIEAHKQICPDWPIEGVVYRCERKGRVDFMAKYVVPEHVPGQYLPEISGGDAVWNWHPEPGKCWWEEAVPHA